MSFWVILLLPWQYLEAYCWSQTLFSTTCMATVVRRVPTVTPHTHLPNQPSPGCSRWPWASYAALSVSLPFYAGTQPWGTPGCRRAPVYL